VAVRDSSGAGGIRETNAATVLGAVRTAGPLSRAAIARHTSLSMPTVSRQVGELIELRLMRELTDRPTGGGIGRPRVPVDLNDEAIAACGLHIGVTTTTYGLVDLRGRLLGSERMPTPRGGAEDALAHVATKAGNFLRNWPERKVIGLGVATGGRIDGERGVLDHERLGWFDVPARVVLEEATGLPVHLDGHVPAMAEAELLFGEAGRRESSMYFYARQVVGVAVAVGGRLHRGPAGQAGAIAHLPIGSEVRCPCGRTGCLEATVAEQAVVTEAVRQDVIGEPDIRLLHAAAGAGDATARRILTDRARALGRAVGILRDIVNPELVVLGGQAITDAPDQLDALLGSFAETTALPSTGIVEVTRFGPDVQAMAACTGLLAQLYARPFTVLAANAS
jgi:predicted NBD/HSP70 family sugar kinase